MMSLAELTDELLQVEIVGVDPTLRLALSLVSRRFHRLLGPSKNFDSWKFIFEVINRGYTKLFEFAVANGAPLDPTCLTEAAKANQVELGKRILPHVQDRLADLDSIYIFAYGGKHNNREWLNLLPIYGQASYQFACEASARAGHVELAKELFPRAYISDEQYHLAFFGAGSGDLEITLSLCNDREALTEQEISSIFYGACNGGHLALAKFAVEQGFVFDSFNSYYDLGRILNPFDIPIMEYLISLNPAVFEREAFHLARRFSESTSVSVEYLKWFDAHDVRFDIIEAEDWVANIVNYTRFSPGNEKEGSITARIEALRYLDAQGVDLLKVPNLLPLVCRFVETPLHVNWILDLVKQDNRFVGGFEFGALLGPYVSGHDVAQLPMLELLGNFERPFQDAPDTLRTLFLSVILLGNNIEVLNWYHKRSPKLFESGHYSNRAVTHFIGRVFSAFSKSPSLTTDLDMRRRLRLHNAIDVIEWFMSKGLVANKDIIRVSGLVQAESRSPFLRRELKRLKETYSSVTLKK